MSINTAIVNSLSVCGPVFNLLIYALPHHTRSLAAWGLPGYALVFDHYTYVGYFVCVAQLVIALLIVARFEEPPRERRASAPRAAPTASTMSRTSNASATAAPLAPSAPLGRAGAALTLGGLLPWPRVFLDPWLRATGAWAIFVVNFRSNFSGYAYTYCLPLITARDYGFGQLSNSYVFGVIAGVRIGVTLLVSRLAKRYSDRGLMLSLVSCSLALTLAYCACSRLSTERVPLAALVALFVGLFCSDSGPPTQGLYSKLIGRGHAGLYFAVLQSNGAIARALAGQLVGLAYGRLGPAALWGTMIALAAGMLPLLAGMWPRFELAHVRAMHERLAAARCAGAAAASVNGEGGAGGEGAAGGGGGEGEGGARPKHDARKDDPLTEPLIVAGFGFDDAGFSEQGSLMGSEDAEDAKEGHEGAAPS